MSIKNETKLVHLDGGELVVRFKPNKKVYDIRYKEFAKTVVLRLGVDEWDAQWAKENARSHGYVLIGEK